MRLGLRKSAIRLLLFALFALAPRLAAAAEPGPGKFLVARPGMTDPNFAETVVLLLEHNAHGALGVVVNRPTRGLLSELLPEIDRFERSDDVVFAGGPVFPDNLILLARTTSAREGCKPVLPDLCAGSARDLLEPVPEQNDEKVDLRVFAGYAGWGPGQLDWEISLDGWYVLAADSRTVFDRAPSDIWPHLIRRAESQIASVSTLKQLHL